VSKIYGQGNPSFVSYNGLVAGDTLQTAATLNWDTPPAPTVSTVPGLYRFTVNKDAAAPNYNLVYQQLSGSLRIDKAQLTVLADNKTKIADDKVFNPVNFTYTVPSFGQAGGWAVSTDTPANSFLPPGLVEYNGPAVTATVPGTYAITVDGDHSLQSDKYTITYVAARLTITGPITFTTKANDSWAGGRFYDEEISQANGGQPGANPGWSLLNVTGTLDLTGPTQANPFQINLISINPATTALDLAAKFDPTRPYAWKFVQAGSIQLPVSGFNSAAFPVNLISFSNKVANASGPAWGNFATALGPNNTLYITYTPIGFRPLLPPGPSPDLAAPKNPIPNGWHVNELLANVLANPGVPVLYMQADKYSVRPQEDKVTINLNIANLGQVPVIGAQALVQFSSQFFIASAPGTPGAPTVVGSGGTWAEPIYKLWYVGGELDMVLGVDMEHLDGTTDDGTIAKVLLTPTRTATGTSRVIFRQDYTGNSDPGLASADATKLFASDNSIILPARVMTDEITVNSDYLGPVITMQATESQRSEILHPNTWKTVDVLVPAPLPAGFDLASHTTVRGTVNITISAIDTGNGSDTGVGLRNTTPVELALHPGQWNLGDSGTGTPMPVGQADNSTFTSSLSIDGSTLNGYWTVEVTAYDNYQPAHVSKKLFRLLVNKNEITGILELDGFAGPDRLVTFKTTGAQWDLDLQFKYTPYMEAGAFSDRLSLATKLDEAAQNDTVSAYLRLGSIDDLAWVTDKLLNAEQQHPFIPLYSYLRALILGDIPNNLSMLAATLGNPTRAIDSYILGRISPATLTALHNYLKGGDPAPFKYNLLNDFNTIIMGPSIWDPARFQSVPVVLPLPGDTVSANRELLNAAYPEYIPGYFDPVTADLLVKYGGGDTSVAAALLWNLLANLDELTINSSLWGGAPSLYTEARFLFIVPAADTLALLETVPTPTGADLVTLNRLLLRDGLSGHYEIAPLTAQAIVVLQSYLQAVDNAGGNLLAVPAPVVRAFDAKMVQDLNALITTTPLWQQPAFSGIFLTLEMKALIASNPSPGSDEFIKLNRLFMEGAYPTQISLNVLARFVLTKVPEGTTRISAKTAWNLRSALNLPAVTGAAPDGVAYFVNDGIWQRNPNGTAVITASNHKLLAGDVTGDNMNNMFDYNIMKKNWPSMIPPKGGAPADLNGDGVVNPSDLNLLKLNWGKVGDPE